jgi:hypothetical protein
VSWAGRERPSTLILNLLPVSLLQRVAKGAGKKVKVMAPDLVAL